MGLIRPDGSEQDRVAQVTDTPDLDETDPDRGPGKS
jgi:hypothetical protein